MVSVMEAETYNLFPVENQALSHQQTNHLLWLLIFLWNCVFLNHWSVCSVFY